MSHPTDFNTSSYSYAHLGQEVFNERSLITIPSNMSQKQGENASGAQAPVAQVQREPLRSVPAPQAAEQPVEQPMEQVELQLFYNPVPVANIYAPHEQRPLSLSPLHCSPPSATFTSPLATDIDTRQLAATIQSLLYTLSISLRTFAKVLLNRAPGTVSDNLTKPSPWSKIGYVGRVSFQRMQYWSNLPAEKQRKVMTMSHEQYSKYIGLPEVCNRGKMLEKRAPRIKFTEEEKRFLHDKFSSNARPGRQEMAEIAEQMGRPLTSIQNFFLNTRNRTQHSLPDQNQYL